MTIQFILSWITHALCHSCLHYMIKNIVIECTHFGDDIVTIIKYIIIW
jgi:hypothetical protein